MMVNLNNDETLGFKHLATTESHVPARVWLHAIVKESYVKLYIYIYIKEPDFMVTYDPTTSCDKNPRV